MVMPRSAQTGLLATYLLPFLRRTAAEDQETRRETFRRRRRPAQHDPDLDGALLTELALLLEKDPELRGLAEDGSPDARRQAAARLATLLVDVDPSALEMIWARIAEPVGGSPGAKRPAKPKRATWLRRQIASGAMNLLIGLVVLVTFVFAWLPAHRHWPLDVTFLALFALWCLSFLPGWLYIRFLGQRAGALWDEYVLYLHRLKLDEPQYLPRPPSTSEYFAEWVSGGGPLYTGRHSIYRQKFDAYYGQSVSSGEVDAESGVRVGSLFPLFLLTVTLAVGWAAVLWDFGFLTAPEGGWDVLKYAFLGAYFFITQTLLRRFFQSDLRPSAYAAAVLRIIVALLVVAALYQVMGGIEVHVQLVVAFVVGLFPIVGLRALQRAAAVALRDAVPSISPDYPLTQLDGMNVWYESRLLEEGIEDLQSLTTANLVEVILHTRVPVSRIVDWLDQAHLYLRLGRTENTRKERKLAKDNPDVHLRQGTKDRDLLRNQGIRTATDYLKTYPPVDGEVPAHPGQVDEATKWRVLSHVLHAEPALNPVWNWQKRGVKGIEAVAASPTA
ncbi:hypothetical protein [Amycolatopsis anabasis]|uniref:hypothetical protein n=1 Tax=Amycolatopsis anabasis TaxID=1840409 RepID=UPI00131BB92C|nr:hypothetical protein [Amycolatopsis anabasis]